MVRGAKEELLRSNTHKVTKLEGKNGGAAPELLRSSSGAAPERLRSREEQGGARWSKVEQKKLIKICPTPKQILRHIFDQITS
jgi:hypothetical protein